MTAAHPASARETDDYFFSAEDEFIRLERITWTQYLGLIASRGEAQSPKFFYLDGVLELMSPSTSHEMIKTLLARLIEHYALERDVELYGYGSWTLTSNRKKKGGLEPDECYTIGKSADKIPDFAVEVVWTSGSLSKLDIYQRLGVPEVWQWKKGALQIFALTKTGYKPIARSRFLPELDPAELCKYLALPQPQAVRAFRDSLRRPARD